MQKLVSQAAVSDDIQHNIEKQPTEKRYINILPLHCSILKRSKALAMSERKSGSQFS
jgi:hypothetical protein